MKKIILNTICGLFFMNLTIQMSYAQWATDTANANVYLSDTTKSVSIGMGTDYLTLFANFNAKYSRANTAIFRTENTNSGMTISRFQPQIYYNLYYDNSGTGFSSFTNQNCWIQGSDEGSNNFSLAYYGVGPGIHQHISWANAYMSIFFRPTGNGNETNCGIGTNNPQYRLDVNGTLRTQEATNGGYISLDPSDGGLEIASGNDGIAYIDFHGSGQLGIDRGGRIKYDEASDNLKITDVNALSVCGKILAQEVKLQAGTGWCDYVFNKDYNLRPLEDVKDFINTNKHLPDVTSGSIIESEGLALGETSAQMIKKIEELTLYMIQMNDRMKEKDAQIEKLQKEVDLLKNKK